MRTARASALALLSAASLLFFGQDSARADVTAVRGEAYGYFASVSLFGGPPNTRGPTPIVTLPATGSAVPITASQATGLVQFGPAIVFSSGQLTVSTQGTLGPGGVVISSADIDDINTSGQEVFTADGANSSCTATETGVSGLTTITNGKLQTSEGNPDVEGDEVIVNVPTNPAPNTTYNGQIEAVGDSFQAIFNEQIINPDGSITVYAYHLRLLGPTAVGDLYVGKSECGVTGTGPVETCATETESSPGVTRGPGPDGSLVHTGTSARDIIVGTSRVDVIKALGGNDLVCARANDDRLAGGSGNDVLEGQGGSDGADYSQANAAVDVALKMGEPQATGEGTDTLVGIEGLFGSAFADELDGSNRELPEFLSGGNGADLLRGFGRADTLRGDDGNDRLEGGFGADAMHGNDGIDTARYQTRLKPVLVDLDDVADDGGTGEGDNVRSTVENIVGGAAADRLVGSDAANVLTGKQGADIFAGLNGNDRIEARDDVDDGTIACGGGTDGLIADALPADNLTIKSSCETVNRAP